MKSIRHGILIYLIFSLILSGCKTKSQYADISAIPFGINYGDTLDSAITQLNDYEPEQETMIQNDAVHSISVTVTENLAETPYEKIIFVFSTLRSQILEMMDPDIPKSEQLYLSGVTVYFNDKSDKGAETILKEFQKAYGKGTKDSISETVPQSFVTALDDGLSSEDLAEVPGLKSYFDRINNGDIDLFRWYTKVTVRCSQEEIFAHFDGTGAVYAMYIADSVRKAE